jgi:hypothetical protein
MVAGNLAQPDRGGYGWLTTFRVLGIERCQQMWSRIGVPQGICEDPQPARLAAQQVLAAGIGRSIGLSYSQGVLERLVNGALYNLSTSYEESEVQVLQDWALRQFVDEGRTLQWLAWSMIFGGLVADVIEIGRPRATLPFMGDKAERFVRVARDYFGQATQTQLDKIMIVVSQTPSSSFEQQVLALEPDEEPRPIARNAVDLLRTLTIAFWRQRAYETWLNLANWLTDAERSAVKQWAREQATPNSGISSRWVEIPPEIQGQSSSFS